MLYPRIAAATAAALAALAIGAAGADAATTATVSDGTLLVQGDPAANHITLGLTANTNVLGIDTNDDGTPEFTKDRATFDHILLKGGAGADRLRIDDTHGVFTDTEITILDGESGGDTISGGAPAETILGGIGDDTIKWGPNNGNDTIEGQSGADTLALTGSNSSETIGVNPNGTRVKISRSIGSATIDVAGTETLDIAMQGGTDTLGIGDLSKTGLTRINPDLGSKDGADKLTINGSPAADNILISRSVGFANPTVSGLHTVVSPTNFDPAADKLTINAGAGPDQIDRDETLGALPAATLNGGTGDDTIFGTSGPDAINGGAGFDTLLGESGQDVIHGDADNDSIVGGAGEDQQFGDGGTDLFTWNSGDDTDLVEGGDGGDELIVLGSNVGETFAVTPNGTRVKLNRFDAVPFAQDLGSVENLVLDTNGGDDKATATAGLEPLIHLTVDGGTGNDTLSGSDGDDVLVGGLGTDTLTGARGDDSLFGGEDDDQFVWNPGDESDTIEGQAGKDKVQLNGANIAEKIEAAPNGGRVLLTRDIADIVLDLDDVELVDYRALGGADRVKVDDLTGTDLVGFNADLAGSPGGSVGDAAFDSVTATGTSGDDTMSLSGSSGAALLFGLHTSVSVFNAEPTDQLTVDSLGGNDSLDTAGLAPGTITLVSN